MVDYYIKLKEPSQGGPALQKVKCIEEGTLSQRGSMIVIPEEPLHSDTYNEECLKKAKAFDKIFEAIWIEHRSKIPNRAIHRIAREACMWRIKELEEEIGRMSK